ncbi:hypothetical protein CYLTODRAFT_421894 [Cylindrobasidium torrendii FP15055 ss-10]|uniref:Uncharacterized protein n=1 Tax=Cylindrobasidium torrendii FP15055 ss-10 TaxID=1314674 RepID=A0A0D7BC87_9AGAR|nr:hypothetical protein CYLTODRAFT_421894 [Cylindrobasidium torrendii FP15055 ss-10]
MFAFTLALSAIFSSVTVLATSLSSRQDPSMMCHPDFSGRSFSISNSAREWRYPSAEAGQPVTAPIGHFNATDWTATPTSGEWATYTLRTTVDDNLAATLKDKTLSLQIDASTDDQAWGIVCDFCEADIGGIVGQAQAAYGCNITATPDMLCAQIGATTEDAMFVAACRGIDAQNFDFWVV